MSDLYATLNLRKDCSQDEIKKAFRKLAMEHHPDKNDGDKKSEDTFKKINEAYNVLSDPEKRKMYDQFGVVDGIPPGPGAGGGMDINDILRNMFGGGMPGMPGMSQGGFSFVFEDGDDDFPFPGMRGQKRRPEADIVEIVVDVCDIYYGQMKKVEFETLDKCTKCDGCGAQDPSHIIKCLKCDGRGTIIQQMGNFFIQQSTCPSCMGKGTVIKNNKLCTSCKGEKAVYGKHVFELKIPPGIPNHHEMRVDKKGGYNVNTKQTKDIIFRFIHNIAPPYSVDEHMNITYTLDITIEELLAGMKKNITLYNDPVVISSDTYFNPSNTMTIKEKGFFSIKKQKSADLFIKFNVVYTDSDRLVKYHEVLQKVLKKDKVETSSFTTNATVYNVHETLA